MKTIVLVLLTSLIISQSIPAQASEVNLNGFATIKYPSSVKLQKSGCQKIPIEYVTDDNLERENTVFVVAIVPKENKRTYGFTIWFSKTPSVSDNSFSMARVGILYIKVCRKPWKNINNTKKLTPAISPGAYRIFFDGGYIDPITGRRVGDKVEVIRTIKFT